MRFAYLIEPPFNFRTDAGTITGCDVELARKALSMIGIRDVSFVETEFSRLLPGLEQNLWDMTTGLFDTAERRNIAAFSRPIWALADGLLVNKGNPKNIIGYASAAENPACTMAAIRGQIQHGACLDAGLPASRLLVCDTYEEAAQAVIDGRADAYASVAMAHSGFLERHSQLQLDIVSVSSTERRAASGAFGFRRSDEKLRDAIDIALGEYVGSAEHRMMMRGFGFADTDLAVAATNIRK